MNVDIRIIVDVTMGELDLYMSPQEDSFVVLNNHTSGQHQIYLDNRYRWVTEIDSEIIEPLNISPIKVEYGDARDNISLNGETEKIFWTPYIHDCKSLSGSGFYVKDKYAKDLSTYITLHQCNTLLRVFGLRNRLVLTVPQNAHNLSATRFFVALKASSSSTASYGLVFFRQDQLHIDLFVFFSVFFSCFFLFLAVCVVAWKAKQAADLRRARRRQVVELLVMAKRPFAIVTLLLANGNENNEQLVQPAPTSQYHRRLKLKQNQQTQQQQQQLLKSEMIRPIAIEPTSDGMAGVSTVFIRLPGKQKNLSPITLALGSSLTTVSRHFPRGGGDGGGGGGGAGGHGFLRRRGSHHGIGLGIGQQ